MKTVAFFVNPLAGYGGIRNNKGSDNLFLQNIKDSTSIKRAIEFLSGIKCREIKFIVPYGCMGSDEMDIAGFEYNISYYPEKPTTSKDTVNFLLTVPEADLICFVGGDGTARDVLKAGLQIPVMGVPAGVKMYSSVFSINIKYAIGVFDNFCVSNPEYMDAEVADIDEEQYREGKLDISHFGTLKIPDFDGMMLSSKAEYPASSAYDIAEYIIDNMKDDFNYIIGPGSTCKAILNSLGYKTNMLGFDILRGKDLIEEDAGEDCIYNNLVPGHSKIIISIIGGQGFLLGRGNQQISSRVIKKAGFENIMVISSPEKLSGIHGLALDINGNDISIPEFIRVLTGYGQFKIVRTIY